MLEEDHVHVFLQFPPRYSITLAMGILPIEQGYGADAMKVLGEGSAGAIRAGSVWKIKPPLAPWRRFGAGSAVPGISHGASYIGHHGRGNRIREYS